MTSQLSLWSWMASKVSSPTPAFRRPAIPACNNAG
jgi:hypothetical protein